MSYERSVSAPEHSLEPEPVWNLRMPEIRFGRGAVSELGFQFHDLSISEDAHGLIVTDENLTDIGHTERVREHLADAGFDVDVYDESEREPSSVAIEECLSFVRDEQGEKDYDFYVRFGGGSCMDTAKATRAVIELPAVQARFSGTRPSMR